MKTRKIFEYSKDISFELPGILNFEILRYSILCLLFLENSRIFVKQKKQLSLFRGSRQVIDTPNFIDLSVLLSHLVEVLG